MRSPSLRVKVSPEAFEGLSEVAARQESTVETVAGRVLNAMFETLFRPPASQAVAGGKWGKFEPEGPVGNPGVRG